MFPRIFAEFGRLSRGYASQASRDLLKKKIEVKQKAFQVDDKVPVHLKGGYMDSLLFRLTALSAGVGCVMGISTLLQMAFKI